MEEELERLQDQEVCCEISSPKNVVATPRKSHQYGHLNKAYTSMTPIDTLTWKREMQCYIICVLINKACL